MKIRTPKPVENWRSAWSWWSVQITTALASLGPAWLVLPQELKDRIPVEWLPYISPVILLSIVVARVMDQGGSRE